MSRSLPILEQRDTKFLLNSWALLVTIGSDFHQSQALSRSYSSNWPNSLNYHTSMAIGFSPWRPDAVIGTDTMLKQSSLHGSIQQPLARTNPRFASVATMFSSWPAPRLRNRVIQERNPCHSVSDRRIRLPCVAAHSCSHGMSTVYPFSQYWD